MNKMPKKGDVVKIDPNVNWDREWKKHAGKTFTVDEYVDVPAGRKCVSPFRLPRSVRGNYEGYAPYLPEDLILVSEAPESDDDVRRRLRRKSAGRRVVQLFLYMFAIVWIWVIKEVIPGGPFAVGVAVFMLLLTLIMSWLAGR